MDNKEKNSNTYVITDPVLEPYHIQFDQSCYTAIKKIKSGTSERIREQTLGYYTSLEYCIDSIAEDSIKNRDYTSLNDFITTLKTRLEELKKITLK